MGKGSYRNVINVSLPLVMSMAATTVMEFTDRVFLSNYSLDAIAAAMPSELMAFMFLCFFSGIAGYMNVFIAQYTGAGAEARIGICVWQGIYFSLLSALLLAGLSFLSEPIFALGGHPLEIQRLEAVYFRIMCLGGGLNVLGASFACFFSGQGMTRPVMLISVAGMIFNIPLDYALINGLWIFPELGVAGAAIATVCSSGVIAVLYALLIFTRKNEERFGIFSRRRFDRELFARLLKFGVPGSIQFCIDIFAFTFFIFMVGRIGKEELAVTNIVLSINSLAFMPALGFSVGVSTLTGQSIGQGKPDEAAGAARNTIHLLMIYTLLIDCLFLLAPQTVLDLFISSDPGTAEYLYIMENGTSLLRIVAYYVIFDALYMVYIGLLKGAGDTKFIMLTMGIVSILFLILPVYIGIQYCGVGLYFSWACAMFYVMLMFMVSYLRYRQGKWREIKIVEDIYED